jgi:hypothetical protein
VRRCQRRVPSGRLVRLFALEHAFLLLALGLGGGLTLALGWGLGHARWFGAKLGLVLFLVLPMEGIHAYACFLLARATGRLQERGFSVEEMIRTLEAVVLVPALVFMTWASLTHPF